jgi:RTX calcium-binding nonapeptide repeat (4 copies)
MYTMTRLVPLALATLVVAGSAFLGVLSGPSSHVHAPSACAPHKHTIIGTRPRDRRGGSRRNDLMVGSRGDDVFTAGSGRDCVLMGRGNDRAYGGAGADVLLGGPGKDRLIGGRGRDNISGGSGDDRIGARDGQRDRIVCGPGRDVVRADAVDRIGSSCERTTHAPSPPGGGGGGGTPNPPPPEPHDFPNSSNTGVPAGTTLTPYSGPSEISTPGTVIDGKSMGCISISAPGVVIKNSKVSCPSGYAVYARDGAFSGTPLTVQDSEIDCKMNGGNGFGEANITVLRVDVQGCENGFDINQNITIQDSYIHDLYNSGSAHTDGAQLASGHYESGRLVAGSRNVTFLHNTIYGVGADGSFGTSAIISNKGGDRDVLIQNNLLAGGAVALYCEQGATGTNYRVLDNHFSRRFGPKVGYYDISTDCSDEVQSGNVIHETGQPLKLP